MKPWQLTRCAERSLAEILAWTIKRFGEHQAIAYRDTLIERIDAIAAMPRMTGVQAGEVAVYHRIPGHVACQPGSFINLLLRPPIITPWRGLLPFVSST